IWSPLAIDRVAEIAERIAEERPQAAEKWTEEIFDRVRRLERFPESGRTVDEVRHRPDLRAIVHGDFRIVYRLESDHISILTVRHARQVTRLEHIEPRSPEPRA